MTRPSHVSSLRGKQTTYDTPRTGSTDSSSCSGGKHRCLCHKSRCETENRSGLMHVRNSECYDATSHLLYNSVDVTLKSFESARLTKQWLISNRLTRRTELSRNSNPGGIRAKEAGRRVAGTSVEQTMSFRTQTAWLRVASEPSVCQEWKIPPVRCESAKTSPPPQGNLIHCSSPVSCVH